MGMQTRSELDTIHKREDVHFQQTCEEAVKKMNEAHKLVNKTISIHNYM